MEIRQLTASRNGIQQVIKMITKTSESQKVLTNTSLTARFLIILVIIMSCSNSNQEPLFHPFKSSTEYPDYNEVDFLISKGFTMDSVDNKKALTKLKNRIKLFFVLDNNDGIESKIIHVYLDALDTLSADNEMKDFGGQRTLKWKIENDSTWLTKFKFNTSEIEVTLKKRYDKVYLESKFDFMHRMIKN